MTIDARAVLQARARRLARPLDTSVDAIVDSLLIFAIGRARFAIAARDVRGVRAVGTITPVPGGPDSLAGLVLHAGIPRSVWRLGAVAGIDDPPAAWTRLILIGHDLAFGATAIESLAPADAATLAAAGIELLTLAALLAEPRFTTVPRETETP